MEPRDSNVYIHTFIHSCTVAVSALNQIVPAVCRRRQLFFYSEVHEKPCVHVRMISETATAPAASPELLLPQRGVANAAPALGEQQLAADMTLSLTRVCTNL